MLTKRIRLLRSQLEGFLRDFYGIEPPELQIEVPPRIEFGDLALPFPFQLARVLRKPPRQIASEVAEHAPQMEGVVRLEAAGAGFINVFLDRSLFFKDLRNWLATGTPDPSGGKVVVEHTNINPNKAAHIGHLRNAILGDTFVRLLKSSGRDVETQNYIDNTGVQVADVVVGFHFLRKMDLSGVEEVQDRFDYYCWDLYAEVSSWYEGDPTRIQHRHAVLEAIEEGGNEFYSMAQYVSDRIVMAHLRTMERIGVHYDVLPRESEILHLKFWDDAFQQLREKEAIFFSTDGPNKGCWVMALSGENGQEAEEKVIVRSNGTVTYVGKDIAYQLWKFGLLGKTFHYRPFHTNPEGQVVWITDDVASGENEPEFGRANRVYNVIDVRQSYLQRVVVQGLRRLGYNEEADNSTHFSYEMVALSPSCSRDLGIELSAADKDRPYVEVSGRKGLGVKADDLIDKLLEKSLEEVLARQKDLSLEKSRRIAGQIAVGALRYFMLKYTRNSVIAFDFGEALSFEGETGPYLQYSVVRAGNIFRKLSERDPALSERLDVSIREQLWDNEVITTLLQDNAVWQLLLDIGRTEEVVEQSVESLEVAGIARHTFNVAQQFNLFYHKHHILSEPDETKRLFYLAVADAGRKGLARLLLLLGIEVPEKM
jgi:arginyl-tRNA synthetase